MTHLKSNQGLGNEIYKKPFAERKAFGDKSESCFNEYLIQKYGKGAYQQRTKEKKDDVKLPDFYSKLDQYKGVEFEVKSINKIKYRDFNYQLKYAIQNNILVLYVFVIMISNFKMKFRPIKIGDLPFYRLSGKDGVYDIDSTPKPYFMVDWKNVPVSEWEEFEDLTSPQSS